MKEDISLNILQNYKNNKGIGKQIFANKYDNLNKMKSILERHKLPNLFSRKWIT